MRSRFDLVDLQVFLNVVDANSMTRGAASSGLSLTATSLRLKNTELAVGTQLLYRNKNGITLTAAGKVFEAHARRILQQVSSLHGDLRDHAGGVAGHIRVLATTTSIAGSLPTKLGRFLARNPDISIGLTERRSQDTVLSIREGAADVGIVAGDLPIEGLETLPYGRDRLVLVTPKAHALAARRSVDFVDALGYDFVSIDARSALFSFLARAAAEHGHRVSTRIQVGEFETMCRLIEANVGIAVMPEAAVRRYARSMEVRQIRLRDPWAERTMTICIRARRELPGFAQQLVDFLADRPRQAKARPARRGTA